MNGKQTTALALLTGCLALFGCGSADGPKGGDGKGGRTIGITFLNFSSPFFRSCKTNAEAVVEAHGDELLVVNAEYDAAKQMNAIEDFIQRGVACILLNPVNSDAAVPAVKKANAAGIPVVTFDINANGGKIECFVESNNILAGALCADYIGWRLKGQGKIVIVDHPGVTSVQQRVQGFKDHLANAFPNIEIRDTQVGEGNKEKGMAATENMLQAHPDIDAIFAINDPSGLGATQAVKAANNTHVFVVGIDGAPDAVAELQKGGPFAMSVAQFPQEIGRVAAEMAYKVLAGEKVPEHVRIRVMPVTKDNLDQYAGWEGKMVAKIACPWESKVQLGEESK
jgi:ribose transport system substrate-binding protein